MAESANFAEVQDQISAIIKNKIQIAQSYNGEFLFSKVSF